MSGQSENVSHAHRECVKLRGRVKELEAVLVVAQAREAALREALSRLVYLRDNIPPPGDRVAMAHEAWSKAHAALGDSVGATK